MTRSVLDATPASMLGAQLPRVELLPAGGRSHPDLDAAVELVAAAGLVLDPWQEHVLRCSLLQRGSRWAAMQVGLVCPRQNGKNAVLEARELAGLFVLGEELIVHSAHLADTAKEAFRRLDQLIDANDWLSREVKHVWRTNGHEAIELRSGQRIKFKTRTVGGGRGLSGDLVIFDEAMIFPEASHAAVLPILSARPNPQAWYTGSAVDQLIHDNGRVLASIRERGVTGESDSLAYFEWSADHDSPDRLTVEEAADERLWAVANPALNRRITSEYVRREREAFGFDTRSFAVERLGVGDWPTLTGAGSVISLEKWAALTDTASAALDPVCFAFDVSPDRATAAIGAAGMRLDGYAHVEMVDGGRGTDWLVERVAELTGRHKTLAVLYDDASPAASLAPALEEAGVELTALSAREQARACGLIFDAVEQRTVRHLGQPELARALANATKRPLSDAWAWNRRATTDISPLVACTMAHWGASTIRPKHRNPPRLINLGDD